MQTITHTMNFLRSPILAFTGHLSKRKKEDAEDTRDQTLEDAGQPAYAAGPPPHVLEGHANREDLLGWATDVVSRGKEEKREMLNEFARPVSPFRRMGDEYKRVHEEANRRVRIETEDEVQRNKNGKEERARRRWGTEQRDGGYRDEGGGKSSGDGGAHTEQTTAGTVGGGKHIGRTIK